MHMWSKSAHILLTLIYILILFSINRQLNSSERLHYIIMIIIYSSIFIRDPRHMTMSSTILDMLTSLFINHGKCRHVSKIESTHANPPSWSYTCLRKWKPQISTSEYIYHYPYDLEVFSWPFINHWQQEHFMFKLLAYYRHYYRKRYSCLSEGAGNTLRLEFVWAKDFLLHGIGYEMCLWSICIETRRVCQLMKCLHVNISILSHKPNRVIIHAAYHYISRVSGFTLINDLPSLTVNWNW